MQVFKRLELMAGGPTENTFYKEWDENQRQQYLKEHPDSKYNKNNEDNSNKTLPSKPLKPTKYTKDFEPILDFDRPLSFHDGNLEITDWATDPDVYGETPRGRKLGKALQQKRLQDIFDVQMAVNGDHNGGDIISLGNRRNGKIYNISIDSMGNIDILNDDMTDSVIDTNKVPNGYFDPYDSKLKDVFNYIKDNLA